MWTHSGDDRHCWQRFLLQTFTMMMVMMMMFLLCHQRSFNLYNPRPPTASRSPRLAVHNPNPKLQLLLSHERVKLRTANPNKSPLKIWEKGSVGVSRDCPNFSVPPVISGVGKAKNFKFCPHIHRIDRNKSPWKISARVAVGVLRLSKIFRAPKIWIIFGIPFERRKVDKERKPVRKLKHVNSILEYFEYFCHPYNFELYRFKVCVFFWDAV